MKFSMNGFRRNLVSDTNELGDAIRKIISDGSLDGDDEIELADLFNSIACHANCLNCVSISGDDMFSDMSDSKEARLVDVGFLK